MIIVWSELVCRRFGVECWNSKIEYHCDWVFSIFERFTTQNDAFRCIHNLITILNYCSLVEQSVLIIWNDRTCCPIAYPLFLYFTRVILCSENIPNRRSFVVVVVVAVEVAVRWRPPLSPVVASTSASRRLWIFEVVALLYYLQYGLCRIDVVTGRSVFGSGWTILYHILHQTLLPQVATWTIFVPKFITWTQRMWSFWMNHWIILDCTDCRPHFHLNEDSVRNIRYVIDFNRIDFDVSRIFSGYTFTYGHFQTTIVLSEKSNIAMLDIPVL